MMHINILRNKNQTRAIRVVISRIAKIWVSVDVIFPSAMLVDKQLARTNQVRVTTLLVDQAIAAE